MYLGTLPVNAGTRGPRCSAWKVECWLRRRKRQTRVPVDVRSVVRSVTRGDDTTHRYTLARHIRSVARRGAILNQVAASQVRGENSGGPTKERVHDGQAEGAGISKGVKTDERGG